MSENIYWVEGPWQGKMALAARPRGGDWLSLDLSEWRSAGVSSVVSLLTPDESNELSLLDEQPAVRNQGMKFVGFPIADLDVPASDAEFTSLIEEIDRDLTSGKNVVIHCRQGIGRSGLVATSLLVTKGLSPGAAIEIVSAARGRPVPETDEQRRWIDRFSARLAGSR